MDDQSRYDASELRVLLEECRVLAQLAITVPDLVLSENEEEVRKRHGDFVVSLHRESSLCTDIKLTSTECPILCTLTTHAAYLNDTG